MWNMIRILWYLVATLGGIKQQSSLWGTLNAPFKLDVYKYCLDHMSTICEKYKKLMGFKDIRNSNWKDWDICRTFLARKRKKMLNLI